jgi:hypothetical protein|tara:strand:- start:325 stop:570 length:246 start_codon:yes stop_codon:yes gene_type:complete
MRTITHNGKEYTFGNVNENGVVRELTDEEAIKFADMREADIVKAAEFKVEAEQRESDLSSAKTKLAGLGLTTDEVKAAFGI